MPITSETFPSHVDPSIGLISVGAGNAFEHPAEDTLARLTVEAVCYARTRTGTSRYRRMASQS